MLRRSAPAMLVMLLDAGALAFFVLLVSLEIRIAMLGSLAVPSYRLPEQSLQAIAWLTIGTVLALHNLRAPNPVSYCRRAHSRRPRRDPDRPRPASAANPDDHA